MAVKPDIITEAQKLAPKQAIEFLENQGLKVTATAEQTRKAVEKGLFAVTRSINMELLQDIRDELLKALKAGIPFKEFQENIINTLASKGWTSEKIVTLKDGSKVIIQVTPFRLKTIYRTVLQDSLNKGRFKRQVENASDRPYLMLIDGIFESGRSRATHKSRSGSIKLINSAFWSRWYPPNGFNCTGRTRSLTTAQAKSRGIGVKGFGKPDPGFSKGPLTTFQPKKSKFDKDIFAAGEKMKPSVLK